MARDVFSRDVAACRKWCGGLCHSQIGSRYGISFLGIMCTAVTWDMFRVRLGDLFLFDLAVFGKCHGGRS